MMFDVVGFGALNVDKLYRVNKIAEGDEEAHILSLNQSCGGSAANTLVGLSRLGLNTGFIGKVSKDPEGRLLLENLKKEGVNTEGVILSEGGRSGTVMGFVDPEGQRALYVDPGVNDLIESDEVKTEYLLDSKVLHLSSFVKESIKAQKALLDELPSGVKVSLDPGRIYAERGLDYLEDLLKRTNVLLLNEGELKLLTEKKYRTFKEQIEVLLNYGMDIIVVKRGDQGSYVTDGKESHFIEAFQTQCKDTTGAGDAFNAGFLYGLVKGEELYHCSLMGNYVAACCVKEMGATENLPNASQLRKMDLDSLS